MHRKTEFQFVQLIRGTANRGRSERGTLTSWFGWNVFGSARIRAASVQYALLNAFADDLAD